MLEGIESIIELAMRLERVQERGHIQRHVLLFEAPGTVFDGRRKENDGASIPGGLKDKIAGTMGVGVRKRISGGPSEIGHCGKMERTSVFLDVSVQLKLVLGTSIMFVSRSMDKSAFCYNGSKTRPIQCPKSSREYHLETPPTILSEGLS